MRKIHYLLFVVLVDNAITGAKLEDAVFRIRKCCAENESIFEQSGQCSEFKLLQLNHHIYHMDENEDGKERSDYGFKTSRPWWFPPETKIISRESNKALKEFPKEYRVIAGEDQPCSKDETSYLPTYFYNFSFYDDGSIFIHPNKGESLEINSGMLFDPLSFCIDRINSDLDVSEEEEEMEPVLDIPANEDYLVKLCPCKKATCILKCCQPGMLFEIRDEGNPNSCIKNNKDTDWIPLYSKEKDDDPDYFILHGLPECKPGESVVLPNYPPGNVSGYTIFPNGSAQVRGETYMSEYMEFCGDSIIDSKTMKIHNRILRCYPRKGVDPWAEVKKVFYGWLSVIGAVFLFLTLLIHFYLPSTTKLNDNILIYQTWCMFFGYIGLSIKGFASDSVPHKICIIIGYMTLYSFLAAFFWLNILCFDMSYTFSSWRSSIGNFSQSNCRKRLFYNIYGWVTPALIVLATIVTEFHPHLSHLSLKLITREDCWIAPESFALLLFFYGPIAALLFLNLLFFLYTTFKIMRARNDISSTIRNRNIEKQRFLLYLKMFLLMGLSWVTELISRAVGGPEYYWFIPDTINFLRAEFIFVIICCRKQVLKELKKKLGIKKKMSMRPRSNTRISSTLATTHL